MNREFWYKFRRDRMALAGMAGVALLLAPALLAPLLANARPLLRRGAESGEWSAPFWRYFFAPDSTEFFIEQLCNYAFGALVIWLVLRLICRGGAVWRRRVFAAALVLFAVPFFLVRAPVDKHNYRADEGVWDLRAVIPYSPTETGLTAPFQSPSAGHWLGTDDIGRDVAARMIYGARVSLAVGVLATLIAFVIGLSVGMFAGYRGNLTDLLTMRAIEILICFPSFLLLLILMSILKDRKFDQSILVVIAVIGLTGWMGLAQLVRGEVLKLRELAYMQSCVTLGVPWWRTYFVHLLPNLMAPVLITFSFGVAGAILAESALSFLGFGVQPPTPSWGGLLRQAFSDPFRYWHLTFAPGVALFVAVASFNFVGEGLRRTLPK